MKETKTATATKERPADLFTVTEATAATSLETLPQRAEREEAEERQALVRMQSLMARAGQDPAAIKRELENRYMILDSPRQAVISRSKPSDWVIFNVKDSEAIGYPRDSLLVLAKKFFGIDIYDYRPGGPNGPEPLIVPLEGVVFEQGSQKYPVYTATMWASALCNLTGEALPDARYTARTGRFAGTVDNLDDLRASCRTGLDAMIVRKLTGLRKVPVSELQKLAGFDVAKCAKGSGFGSSSERGAARVAEEGVAEKVAKLRTDILRCVGGDGTAAKDLCRQITRGDKPGKDGKIFAGFDSPDRLTLGWQIDAAVKKLHAHELWAPEGAGEREPGSDD